MTIDEAIKHAEEVAEENQAIVDACDYYGGNMAKCEKCAKEHRQLAEWLKELKAHREAWSKLKNDVVAYHNNYDYDTAIHFLNIIDTRLNDIGSDAE